MYDITTWVDESKDQGGAVIQEGTEFSAANMNKLEKGVYDAHAALQILMQHTKQEEDLNDQRTGAIEKEIEAEYGSKTLTNTLAFPFNNSAATVALSKTRNTHYTVEAVVTSYAGGLPGNIIISDKAINGFKIAFDGSATNVTVDYIVKGGLLS